MQKETAPKQPLRNAPIRIKDNDPLYFAPMTTPAAPARAPWLPPCCSRWWASAPRCPRAQAQTTPNPRVYTVEVIVFRNNSGAGGPEDWSVKPVARGPDTPDAPVTGKFVQSMPAAQFQLNDVAQKLQNTSNYQPIAHFAWQQTASSWGSRAGFTVAKLAGQVPGLSGIIYLESGTYLHLGMSLNYQTSNPPAALAAAPGTVFMLNESRRMRWRQAELLRSSGIRSDRAGDAGESLDRRPLNGDIPRFLAKGDAPQLSRERGSDVRSRFPTAVKKKRGARSCGFPHAGLHASLILRNWGRVYDSPEK